MLVISFMALPLSKPNLYLIVFYVDFPATPARYMIAIITIARTATRKVKAGFGIMAQSGCCGHALARTMNAPSVERGLAP
jgi:hypothetical protein